MGTPGRKWAVRTNRLQVLTTDLVIEIIKEESERTGESRSEVGHRILSDAAARLHAKHLAEDKQQTETGEK